MQLSGHLHRHSRFKSFYTKHFDFETTFEADWYASLKNRNGKGYELVLLDYRHESLPEGFRQTARGMLINFEVADVDAVHNDLKAEGSPMVLDLRSEDWGQRHFITKDPNGILIDVIQNIAPATGLPSTTAGNAIQGSGLNI